jgi:hypothetical protein
MDVTRQELLEYNLIPKTIALMSKKCGNRYSAVLKINQIRFPA